MAKRVIQMYDKYKSTTKTYPKIIKECLQEDVTNYIEGQVEANPTLAGTEASLTGLQIGDTKYAVPQGTTVVANPDPAGETELTGLQIGETKYKIGGGKQLYQHNCFCKSGTQKYSFSLSFVCDVEQPATTFLELKNILRALRPNGNFYTTGGSLDNDGTIYEIVSVFLGQETSPTRNRIDIRGENPIGSGYVDISFYDTGNLSIWDAVYPL